VVKSKQRGIPTPAPLPGGDWGTGMIEKNDYRKVEGTKRL